MIKSFCEKYQFPSEAVTYLDASFNKLKNNAEAYEKFNEFIRLYDENQRFDSDPVFKAIEAMETITGVKGFTLDLLYLIALTPKLKELYVQNGIPEDIYDDSVCDLKWKANECKEVYGYYGMFVGWWTIGFFQLERFAIGRLQYDIQRFTNDFQTQNASFKKDEIYINVHIPSSGALIHEDCQKSYARAAEFYKDQFKTQELVFGCTSWLMSPLNRQILPETSNVLKFMDDYTVVDPGYSNTGDLWRIFGVFNLPENVYDLPQKTSLQRSFVKWLANGNLINIAFAIMPYNKSK